MPASNSSDADLAAVAEVAEDLYRSGLDELIQNPDVADLLVERLHQELPRVPRSALALSVKWLASLVAGQAAARSPSSDKLWRALGWLGLREPVVAGFRRLAGPLIDDAAARRELRAVFEGSLAASATSFATHLPLDLRGHLKALHETGEIKTGLARILERLDPEPDLDLPLVPLGVETRFYFGARKAALAGRDVELAALEAFASNDAAFAWTLVHGPGGAGKSRLVLEFLLGKCVAWRAGFLPRDSTFSDWSVWQPSFPTLIVIDYVGARPDEARDLILKLHRRAQQGDLGAPVRLLLVERQAEGKWRDTLEPARGDGLLVRQAKGGPDIAVGALDDAALWDITRAYAAGRVSEEQRTAVLAFLKRADVAARALFAAFLGDALAAGRTPLEWDAAHLVRFVLEREEGEFWHPAARAIGKSLARHKNLLALATMVQGVPLALLGDPARVEKLRLPEPDEAADEGLSFDLYERMCGRAVGETLPPLEPDILGEAFVLGHLRPGRMERAAGDRRVDRFRDAAWAADYAAMSRFLALSTLDFPGHESLEPLFELPAGTAPSGAWTGLVSGPLIREMPLPLARAVLAQFRGLIERRPYCLVPELRQMFALGQANGIIRALMLPDLAAATELFAELRTWASAWVTGEDRDAYRTTEAQAGVVVARALLGEERREDALQILGPLLDSAGTRPDDRELQAAFGSLGQDLAEDIGRAGTSAEAVARYTRLAKLTEAHPGTPAARVLRARAGAALVHRLRGEDQLETRLAVLERLAAWMASDEEEIMSEPETTMALANGYFATVTASAEAGRWDAADAHYRSLRDLAARHPGLRELQVLCLKAAGNLLAARFWAEDAAEAGRLFGDLARLQAGWAGTDWTEEYVSRALGIAGAGLVKRQEPTFWTAFFRAALLAAGEPPETQARTGAVVWVSHCLSESVRYTRNLDLGWAVLTPLAELPQSATEPALLIGVAFDLLRTLIELVDETHGREAALAQLAEARELDGFADFPGVPELAARLTARPPH